MKKMSAGEFRDEGFLQELNRQFLHPLGLALEVIIGEDGSAVFGGVWNCSTDDEGMIFDPSEINDEFIAKAYHVEALRKKRAEIRRRRFGWTVQPADITASEWRYFAIGQSVVWNRKQCRPTLATFVGYAGTKGQTACIRVHSMEHFVSVRNLRQVTPETATAAENHVLSAPQNEVKNE